jgi:hypothetical protein
MSEGFAQPVRDYETSARKWRVETTTTTKTSIARVGTFEQTELAACFY